VEFVDQASGTKIRVWNKVRRTVRVENGLRTIASTVVSLDTEKEIIERSPHTGRNRKIRYCLETKRHSLKGRLMEKTIEIRLHDENARHLERFLQAFVSTNNFQPPYAGSEIKAFNELYAEIRKALGHSSDEAK
jgi:hypothetical protein